MKIILEDVRFHDNRNEEGALAPFYFSGSCLTVRRSHFFNLQLDECKSSTILQRGGFLFDVTGNTLTIEDSRFEDACALEGAAIYMAGVSKCSISGSLFRNLRSLNEGGAIHAKNFLEWNITNSNFISNSALDGADLYVLDSFNTLHIKDSSFELSSSTPVALFRTAATIARSYFTNLSLTASLACISALKSRRL